MATGKMKSNFKMPTPSAAERMNAQHQQVRKAAGLPDPSDYLKMAAQKRKEIEDMKQDQEKENNPNQGRFSSGASKPVMKTQPLVKSESFRIGGMATGGRGNIHMYDRNPAPRDGSELENVPFHAKTEKQKKLQNALNDLGKKMKEKYPHLKEGDDDITVFKKGSNVRQKIKANSYDTFKFHGFRKVAEAKDPQEYDYEGDMAKSDLRSIMHHAKELHDMIDDTTNLAEWCQSKITLAEDYLSTVANYMRSEMNEEVKKNEYHIAGKHKFPTKDEHAVTVKHTESGREHVHSGKGKYLSKLIKSRYNINHYFEEVELDEMVVVKTNKPIGTRVADIGPGGKEYNVKTDKAYDDAKKKQPQGADFAAQRRKERLAKSGRMDEGRASQRHPLEGHEYHKKSNEALVHIAKDAHAAAEAMKSHNTDAENKYRDQANDSATVRHFRKTSGMPDWYKKKYGHVKEEVEQLDEKKNLPGLWANIRAKKARGESPAKPGEKDYPEDLESVRSGGKKSVKESYDVPFNKPYNKDSGTTTDKSGAKHTPMSKARHLARQAMSKTANKPVKESASEPTEGEIKGKQGYSRKAQIVMNASKGKKSDSPEKYQKDPELSSEIHKT